MTRLQLLALRAARKSWRKVDPSYISESWRESAAPLSPVVSGVQTQAAIAGSEYAAASLAEQGIYRTPQAFVAPQAFAGFAPDGRSLDGLLSFPAVRAKVLIAGGMSAPDALGKAGQLLDRIVTNVAADTARQSASVDIATRRGTGYVRVIVGETCRDCIVLAGRFYRWNAGFARHPGCDCIHEPTTKALSEGQVADPYAHFHSLTREEQDALWGEADAQALRDGADIYRVYNAGRNRRGAPKMTTTEGTSRRGYQRGQRRLTPDGIYKQAGSREEALQLLEQHGYILPGGQVPGGVIRGQREGYGALGRGGTRVGARMAVEQARMTGTRQAGSRYNATAAERRLIDASNRWEAVRQGRNPYARNGKGLTPEIAASVEKDYRRWLRTGGQIFQS